MRKWSPAFANATLYVRLSDWRYTSRKVSGTVAKLLFSERTIASTTDLPSDIVKYVRGSE